MRDFPLPYVVHTDSDKPHRCPNCWLVAVARTPVSRFRTYTCCSCGDREGCPGGCGQRFAKRPWLPYYDETPGRALYHVKRAVRDSFVSFGHRRYLYGFWGAMAYLEPYWASRVRSTAGHAIRTWRG